MHRFKRAEREIRFTTPPAIERDRRGRDYLSAILSRYRRPMFLVRSSIRVLFRLLDASLREVPEMPDPIFLFAGYPVLPLPHSLFRVNPPPLFNAPLFFMPFAPAISIVRALFLHFHLARFLPHAFAPIAKPPLRLPFPPGGAPSENECRGITVHPRLSFLLPPLSLSLSLSLALSRLSVRISANSALRSYEFYVPIARFFSTRRIPSISGLPISESPRRTSAFLSFYPPVGHADQMDDPSWP